MMFIEDVPGNPPPGGAYSQAVVLSDAGCVFLGGHVGLTQDGQQPELLEKEIEVAIENLERTLQVNGGSLSDLLQVTCLLTDISQFGTFDAVYRTKFRAPFPVRATYGIDLAGDLRFEIYGVARFAADKPGAFRGISAHGKGDEK